ncbi:lytic transglycosylase domain-containing protein [uncultured Nocardioides sp.]|uniref:lytic transglycosylase domain-containing protein n=1 Tax=uncultured Nocardioides sp. TaxID=198441 RepID=UPI00263403AF|nr:lytic transglycosylase domain-containing protein [uncultured Nocardioides sp.]
MSTVAAGTDEAPAVALPDGTSVPAQAIDAPASVSTGALAAGIGDKNPTQVVATSSTSGIPAAALAAYQRAETVINAADKTCNLTWQLVAAIGRVESNHGRFGGSVLDDDGVATPGIYGLPLNGTKGTAAISDTDGGQLDNDSRWDRAVGPMQFIPSTWSVVGVDADGDAQRNPQDIDDAALATAVYLCSGDDDLSTTTGQEKAVYRYNHSWSYVDLVLQVMDAYASGDYTSIPTSVSAAGAISPDPKYTPAPVKTAKPDKGGDTAVAPAPQPSQQPAQPQPTTGTGGDGGTKDDDKPKGGLGIPGAPTVTLPTLPTTGVTVVDETLSYAQAVLQCTLDGYIDNILKNDDPFDQCVEDQTS